MKPDKRLSRRGGKVQIERNNPMKNAINWFEILVTDMDKSTRLYEATLNAKLTRGDFGGMPHGVFPAEQTGVTGALVVDPARKPGRGSGTVIYLHAPDLAQAVSRAKEAGA